VVSTTGKTVSMTEKMISAFEKIFSMPKPWSPRRRKCFSHRKDLFDRSIDHFSHRKDLFNAEDSGLRDGGEVLSLRGDLFNAEVMVFETEKMVLAQSARSKPTAFKAVSFELKYNRMGAWSSTGTVRMRFTTSSTTLFG
jgi:hypothetical protein